MGEAHPTPSILLACHPGSSTDQAATSSPFLAERRAIARLLEPAENQGACHLIQEDINPQGDVFRLLEKHSFREPVAALHVCGSYEATGWDVRALSASVGKITDLQLVFLNGCGDQELVELLLLRDIPAIIATQSPVPAPEFTLAVRTFYQALGKGDSIRDAFACLQKSFPALFVERSARYSLEEDRLIWDAPMDPAHFQAGLYTLQESASHLDWRIPAEAVESISSEPEYLASLLSALPGQSTRVSIRSIIASACIVACLLISGFILMALHTRVGKQEKWLKRAIPPLQERQFQMVMLPVQHFRACGEGMPALTDACFGELKRLEEELADFRVNYGNNASCYPLEVASRILQNQTAQMVLWGTYLPQSPQDTLLTIHYAYAEPQGDIQHVQLPSAHAPHLMGATDEHPLQGIAYHALGNRAYAQDQLDEAITLWEQALGEGIVSPMLNRKLALAYNRRGTGFIKEKEEGKAWFDFSQAIFYQPDFAEALYNRGLVNLKFSRYEEALSDLEQVLALGAFGGKVHGALTAVYASMGDEAQFYQSLENALAAGINMNQYIQFTAVGDYQHHPRFKQLIAAYQP